MARKYYDACNELEMEHLKNPSNHSILKKLIICYLKTDRVDKAFENFHTLVIYDPDIIIKTDPVLDDCPCPEIIDEITAGVDFTSEENENIILGILWLYCDVNESIKHFSQLSSGHKYFNEIKEILTAINKKSNLN